ncbi:NADH:ubiquinone oxidoreductase subunit J [Methylopila jiangsuensis]|uniref:NADH-quinone oxidoreductase subunit J n=1 Tax=Methylopila jiangsuensis TaxID=586230 RepID=A0A9W6JHD4_9HYPH|nr:NADH-quinone oxidoreductase subunit J [Methylopila jiangsuensis]MDR6284204.1 NADH-quinone oxidoreductase subunit J [Methylopila jiangsuensis]GLK76278.1 NADH:ubiquinone oxidoreductase subunit J [Methylopila jiangsuensis]
MSFAALFFYLFATVTVASAFMVIAAKNPVHSVLFLILAFVNAAGLFVLMGAEFLAMILVVVYVGAVAVLFMFVTMMLDVDFAELRDGFLQYLPVGALVGAIVLVELVLVVGTWSFGGAQSTVTPSAPIPADVTNAEALGRVLYTEHLLLFQAAGLVLLTAMIGAIVLTLRERRAGVKRQDISAQVARGPATAIEVVKARPGEGLSEGTV